MNNLKGKICCVTGAGQGLGIAIAEVLAEAGGIVIGCDVERTHLKAMENFFNRQGKEIVPIQADVSDEADSFYCIQSILKRFERIDILVNNAGIDATLPIDEMQVRQWDRILAVNLRGPFLMSKAAFKPMKAQGGGQIVNIVSTASKRTWANAIAYHSSKWGLLGFSHALHVEGRGHNIKVTAVVSGGMRTPFLLDRFPGIDPDTLQDPKNVADTVKFVLEQKSETVIPEVMVIPMKETSWP